MRLGGQAKWCCQAVLLLLPDRERTVLDYSFSAAGAPAYHDGAGVQNAMPIDTELTAWLD
jgi:hypothetical protein